MRKIDYAKENNLSSVAAKRWCFLPTTYKLTPHIKAKKCTQKSYIMLQRIHFLLLSYFFLPADYFFLPFLFSSSPLLLCHLRLLFFFFFLLLLPCSSAISIHSCFFCFFLFFFLFSLFLLLSASGSDIFLFCF
jgi:hypothetical protein